MKKAFTLLEVLLTVSLMMIILSIGWIKFQPMLAIRENQEVRQLLRDLNYTRNIAIRSNRSATFRITAETSYQIDAESEMIERDLQSVRIVKYPSQQIS